MYKVNVKVLLKDDVLDPQGKTVQKALDHLGYNGIENVRIGKFIEFLSDKTDEKILQKQVKEMCKTVLTNPVVEKFEFSLEQVVS
ncbi:MAG: phosphoribosylformylglycinamidine synthase subunit PurS [Candidatus Margulisiibacteriota bacterium]